MLNRPTDRIQYFSFRLRDKLFPILLNIIKKDKVHELRLKNEKPDLENVIYAVSHYSCHDFKYASEVIGKRCWVLVGKQRFDMVSLIGLRLNGIIWADRNNKYQKKRAVKRINKLLQLGENVIIFPEGTWNMTHSLPIMPLYWGIIDIARETKRPIVPLVFDYEYAGGTCSAMFGQPMYIRADDEKLDKINELRDEMCTLLWLNWEKKPLIHRSDVSQEMWKKELDYRLGEYPLLDAEYEKSFMRGLHQNENRVSVHR